MKERRSYTRFDTDGVIALTREDDAANVITADLNDLSYIGLSMSAKENIATGTRVKFEITSRFYSFPIHGIGIITYLQETKKPGMNRYRLGLQFVSVDKSAIAAILTAIQREINLALRNNKLR